jgi:hypothetical protein
MIEMDEAGPVRKGRPPNYPDLLARGLRDNPNPVRFASRTPPPCPGEGQP